MGSSKKMLWVAAVGLVVLAPALMSAQIVSIDRVQHVFRDVQMGQPVQLKDAGSHYELTLIKQPNPAGPDWRVLDNSWDYILLGDGKTTISIPITSIKAIHRDNPGAYEQVKGWYDNSRAEATKPKK